ncbi:MAG: hypothetical protein KAJ17_12065 [Candidatus Krumholzibacteria bacterium]|nr:hypothetical protein [Candidatus Krumholzibacteria bacterium]
MRTTRRSTLVTSVIFVVVLAGAVVATVNVERYNFRPYLHDNLYLPSGKFLEQVSLGYKQIVSDMIWFSAIQYYGGYRKEEHDLAYFEGLIDLVTDLDPHFIFPYMFGAMVMSQDMESFDAGMDILRKGMHHNPTEWELPFEIGFLSFVDARDHDMAARYFDLASRLPGAPDLTRRFAAFVYSKAGHDRLSIRMWEELKETTDEPYMRELAERYLEDLRHKQQDEQKTLQGGRRDRI